MIVIEINGDRYNTPVSWEEITLSRAASVHDLFKEIPKELFELYKAVYERKSNEVIKMQQEFTDEQIFKVFPEFYGKIMSAVSDIPDDVMSKVDTLSRQSTYSDHYEWIVYGLLFTPSDIELRGIKEFKHNGVWYFLPKSGKQLDGSELPGINIIAGEFAQSADVMRIAKGLDNGNYSLMANYIAILCREEGKPYDEQEAIERAEGFKDLPMSVVWEVYFFTFGLLMPSQGFIQNLMSVLASKSEQRQRKADFQTSDGTEASYRLDSSRTIGGCGISWINSAIRRLSRTFRRNYTS